MYQFHPVNTGFVDDLVGLFVGMHFDVGCGKRCGDLRKERFGDVTVHEEFFSGVADATRCVLALRMMGMALFWSPVRST